MTPGGANQPELPGFGDEPSLPVEAGDGASQQPEPAAGLPLFENATGGDGKPLDKWREERRAAFVAACTRLGAPLHRMVEVRLVNGTVLRGRLCLADEELWVEPRRETIRLSIDAASFLLREIESVVTL